MTAPIKRPRGRPPSPDTPTRAEAKRQERARRALGTVELPRELLAEADRIAARDGDAGRAAVLARALARLA